jgi:hypothetical protein
MVSLCPFRGIPGWSNELKFRIKSARTPKQPFAGVNETDF